MAQGLSPEQVESRLDASHQHEGENEGDWLLKLFGGSESPTSDDARSRRRAVSTAFRPVVSIRESDFQFARTALRSSLATMRLLSGPRTTRRKFAITAPLDLQDRLRQLLEVQASGDRYVLCANAVRMAQAIEEARQKKAEEGWASCTTSGRSIRSWNGSGSAFSPRSVATGHRSCGASTFHQASRRSS